MVSELGLYGKVSSFNSSVNHSERGSINQGDNSKGNIYLKRYSFIKATLDLESLSNVKRVDSYLFGRIKETREKSVNKVVK